MRKTWKSVSVAQRDRRKSATNITSPPRRLPKKLKVASPMTATGKTIFVPPPQIVSGLLMDG